MKILVAIGILTVACTLLLPSGFELSLRVSGVSKFEWYELKATKITPSIFEWIARLDSHKLERL